MTDELEITLVDPRSAPIPVLESLHDHANQMRSERMPDDPPVPWEEALQNWRTIPATVDTYIWQVCPAGSDRTVAVAHLYIDQSEHNRHLANGYMAVLPAYRRQGIARRLLALMLPIVRRADRRLLMAWTVDSIPASEVFLERLGAERGLESHTNQLIVADIDRELLAHWQARAPERAAEYHLQWCDGPVPDTELPAVLKLWSDVTNAMPRGSLQTEDQDISTEQWREQEQMLTDRGWQRWIVFARDKDGAYAGFTEMTLHPNRPYLMEQGGTGVDAAHQNRGLGRWLKAAMLDRAIRELPSLRFIRTSNAVTNAPMLAINHALGFLPFQTSTVWQIETDALAAYLDPARA